MGDNVKVFGCGCFCVVLIVSIILFACSFSIVELDQWGIIYDHNYQEIEREPHGSGRYLAGLGRKFLTFPRGFILVEFNNQPDSQTNSPECWTNDGVNVYIDISFYFILDEQRLREMYFEFGETWYASIVRLAYTSIKDTTTNFKTTDFFNKREQISVVMRRAVQGRLDQFTSGAVNLKEINLRKIIFDSDFEQAIIQKLMQLQEKKTKDILQQSAKILKESDLISQRAKNNITIIQAQANANGTIILADAKAEALKTVLKQEVKWYKKLKTDLGLTTDDQFLRFIYINEMAQISNKTKVIVNPKNVLVGV